MKKLLLGAAAALFLTAGANAAEIYAHVGTEGLGLGVGYALDNYHGVRAEVSGFNLGRSFKAGELEYDADLKVRHLGLYYDFHPFGNTFRLSAGAIINSDRAAVSSPEQTVSYRGTSLLVPAGAMKAEVKMPRVMPYLGLGVGHGPAKGWGFAADLGVAFGKPSSSFSVSPQVQAYVPQSVIDEQRGEVERYVNKVKFFPVVKLGVTYAF
ncbi:hypothetical protein D3C71_21800 [compost metagenome]